MNVPQAILLASCTMQSPSERVGRYRRVAHCAVCAPSAAAGHRSPVMYERNKGSALARVKSDSVVMTRIRIRSELLPHQTKAL